MKEKYITPELTAEKFSSEDIMTMSGPDPFHDETQPATQPFIDGD